MKICDAIKAMLKGKLIKQKVCIRKKISNELLQFPTKETKKKKHKLKTHK